MSQACSLLSVCKANSRTKRIRCHFEISLYAQPRCRAHCTRVPEVHPSQPQHSVRIVHGHSAPRLRTRHGRSVSLRQGTRHPSQAQHSVCIVHGHSAPHPRTRGRSMSLRQGPGHPSQAQHSARIVHGHPPLASDAGVTHPPLPAPGPPLQPRRAVGRVASVSKAGERAGPESFLPLFLRERFPSTQARGNGIAAFKRAPDCGLVRGLKKFVTTFFKGAGGAYYPATLFWIAYKRNPSASGWAAPITRLPADGPHPSPACQRMGRTHHPPASGWGAPITRAQSARAPAPGIWRGRHTPAAPSAGPPLQKPPGGWESSFCVQSLLNERAPKVSYHFF